MKPLFKMNGCQLDDKSASNCCFFRELPAAAAKFLEEAKMSSIYPAGSVLFQEGEDPRGVFVLCEGQVKLTISSSEGKTLILRVAKAGELMGLMSVLSGSPYEVTAEILHSSRVAFIRRQDFMHVIH